jgi:hypothetical protein
MTNEERAGWGASAVENGTPDFGESGADVEGRTTDVADALANVMHHCDAEGVDFELALERARADHAAEAVGSGVASGMIER